MKDKNQKILYDSNYMKFSKNRDSKKRVVVFRGWEEMEGVDGDEFSGSETILYDTIMMDMFLYVWSNPQNAH